MARIGKATFQPVTMVNIDNPDQVYDNYPNLPLISQKIKE